VLFRILDLYYPSAKNMYEGYINLSGYTAMDAAQTYAGYILGQYGGGSGDSLSNHFSHQIGLEYAFAETENAHRKNTFWDALHTSIAAQTPRTQDFKEFTSTVCFIGEERDSDPPVPGVRELTISSATASSNDGNIPENTIDNNLDTRWSAEGDGEWIEFDLGAEYIISELRIAFFRGDERTTTFDIQTSTNQDQWETVFSGVSSGITLAQEQYNIQPPSTARYVRIVGHGNSISDWNSITEVDVIGYDKVEELLERRSILRIINLLLNSE